MVLSACESATAPTVPEPWFAGSWRAVTVDGRPLPASFPAGVVSVRYDSLTASFGTGVIHSFAYSGAVVGVSQVPLGCSGLVFRDVRGDTVTITGANTLNNCPNTELAGRRFVRAGDTMTHAWAGRTFVLRRD